MISTYFLRSTVSIQQYPKGWISRPRLLRRCACSDLKVLTELTPALFADQHSTLRSLVYLFTSFASKKTGVTSPCTSALDYSCYTLRRLGQKRIEDYHVGARKLVLGPPKILYFEVPEPCCTIPRFPNSCKRSRSGISLSLTSKGTARARNTFTLVTPPVYHGRRRFESIQYAFVSCDDQTTTL